CQECRDAGEGAYDLLAYASNSDAATNVAGGKGDILMADSPVTAYAIRRSRGTLEAICAIEESARNGIVVAKDQPELAEASRAAVQHLIDSGHMERVLAAWRNEAGLIPTAEVNPQPRAPPIPTPRTPEPPARPPPPRPREPPPRRPPPRRRRAPRPRPPPHAAPA